LKTISYCPSKAILYTGLHYKTLHMHCTSLGLRAFSTMFAVSYIRRKH
jgi:hypothetical protein